MALTVSIILFGPISNSHVNPAVTLGVLIRETGEKRAKGKFWYLFGYTVKIWIAQIGGALFGAAMIALVRYEETVATARLCSPIGGVMCANFNGNGFKMLFAEIIGTFLFVSVNVNIIYFNGSTELILNAIIIGLALILGIFVAAPISGGSINPAVGIV